MKLVVLLSLAAFVACNYSSSDSETSTTAFTTSEKGGSTAGEVDPFQPGKFFPNFKNSYLGAFPPVRFPPVNFFPPSNFPSVNYPLKTFNYAASLQGTFPTISQIIPPQVSQIVPPFSQIVPPILGNTKPAFPTLPAPSPVLPSPTFSPQILSSGSKPLFNQFIHPYYSPFHHLSYFPSAFSFPSNNIFSSQTQKQQKQQPSKSQQESPSTSYGPPVLEPVEPEPAAVPVESSAPLEPPVSFPYESATPDVQEPVAPYKPAQEYGLPPSN